MKALIFSSKDSLTQNQEITRLLGNLRVNRISVESIDKDSSQGAEMAEAYGVMDYPAVVINSEDGLVRGFWHGKLPSSDEISQTVGYIQNFDSNQFIIYLNCVLIYKTTGHQP